jgi:WD40 repeat protein
MNSTSHIDHVFEQEGEVGWIRDVAFSADGKRIVTAGLDGVARIWEIDTDAPIWETEPGKELKKLRHTSAIMPIAFSPDETKIVTT